MSVSPTPSEHGAPAPSAGEEIHLPGPSILPLICAIGITFMVIGTTLGYYLSAIGFVIFVPTVVRWVRDTRRDVASLPEHHES